MRLLVVVGRVLRSGGRRGVALGLWIIHRMHQVDDTVAAYGNPGPPATMMVSNSSLRSLQGGDLPVCTTVPTVSATVGGPTGPLVFLLTLQAQQRTEGHC